MDIQIPAEYANYVRMGGVALLASIIYALGAYIIRRDRREEYVHRKNYREERENLVKSLIQRQERLRGEISALEEEIAQSIIYVPLPNGLVQRVVVGLPTGPYHRKVRYLGVKSLI